MQSRSHPQGPHRLRALLPFRSGCTRLFESFVVRRPTYDFNNLESFHPALRCHGPPGSESNCGPRSPRRARPAGSAPGPIAGRAGPRRLESDWQAHPLPQCPALCHGTAVRHGSARRAGDGLSGVTECSSLVAETVWRII
eukprot:306728-Hanusia_phi.AAC.1